MKPILYNHTVPVFKEYKFRFPLNNKVKTVKQSWINSLLIKLLNCRFVLSIKKEIVFWLKMVGFIDLN